MMDFDELKVDLDGPHLVAASAGTGKTHALSTVYVRLLLEKGFPVSRILVVTFTRAATRDLRKRLLELLANLAKGYRDECISSRDNALCHALIDKYPDGGETVQKAYASFGDARIDTIHAFCERILRNAPLSARIRFEGPLRDRRVRCVGTMARDVWKTRLARKGDLNLDSIEKFADGVKSVANRKTVQADRSAEDFWAAVKINEAAEAEFIGKPDPDYDDLIRAVYAAVSPAENPFSKQFVEKVRSEYDAALIDEFQDTDPLQYGIFAKLFLPSRYSDPGMGEEPILREESDCPPSFFVGDPKQAIYGFRGGDVYTYMKAYDEFEKSSRVFQLNENFRSAAGVVKAVNDIFRDVQPPAPAVSPNATPTGNAPEDAPPSADSNATPAVSDTDPVNTFDSPRIPYDGSIRSRGSANPLEKVAPDGSSTSDPRPVELVYVPKSFVPSYIANEVVRLLKGNPLDGEREPFSLKEDGPAGRLRSPKASDIGIVVKTNQEGLSVRRALTARGVRSHFEKGSVFQSLDAPALLALLETWAGNGGASERNEVLVSPFFGISPNALLAMLSNRMPMETDRPEWFPKSGRLADGFSRIQDIFDKSRKACEKFGVMAALATLDAETKFRPRFMSIDCGERRLADVECMAELLQEEGNATDCMGLAGSLRRHLAESAKEDAPAKELTPTLESETDAVRIHTIHTVKGLEFPIVFVHGDPHGINNLVSSCFVHDGNGNLWISKKPNRTEDSSLFSNVYREKANDDTKTLYVALTRGKCKTVLVQPDSGNNNRTPDADRSPMVGRGINLVRTRMKTLGLSRNGTVSAPVKLTVSSAAIGGPFSDEVPAAGTLPGWDWRNSFSGLVPAEKSPTDFDPPADPAEVFRLPRGSQTGNALHELLEKIDFSASAETIADCAETCLRRHGVLGAKPDVRAERQRIASKIISDTLSVDFDKHDGAPFKLSDIPRSDRMSEWNFEFGCRTAVDDLSAIAARVRSDWSSSGKPQAWIAALDRWTHKLFHGYFTGFADLVFRHENRYYVLDWKTNSRDCRPESFSEEGVAAEMARCEYFLQYLLYAAVLHRHLRETLPGYCHATHFGGVYYVFLRGVAAREGAEKKDALFFDRPPEALLDGLCRDFGLEDREGGNE